MKRAVQTRDPELTKNLLLDASEKLFLEHGFGRVSLSDIAAESGVTKSLIHHYYGTKQNLWAEVKRRLFGEYYRQQKEDFAQIHDRGDLLESFISRYFEHLETNPKFVRMVQWMYLERNTDSDRVNRELITTGVQTFQAGVSQGFLRDDVSPLIMQFITLALPQIWFMAKESFLANVNDAGTPQNIDEIFLDSMKKILLRGIRK